MPGVLRTKTWVGKRTIHVREFLPKSIPHSPSTTNSEIITLLKDLNHHGSYQYAGSSFYEKIARDWGGFVLLHQNQGMAHITPRVSFFATCNILEEQSNNSLPPLSIEMKPICTSQTIEGRKLVFCKCPLKACKKKASKEKRGKNDITVHIRSNTGERPFICKDCKKGYVCNSSLKTHSCTKRKKWKICWKHKNHSVRNHHLIQVQVTCQRYRYYVCKLLTFCLTITFGS